jgi:hypothetical protein
MADHEPVKALAQRHVDRGREIVARQRRIMAEIRARGGDSELAEQLLSQFERSLVLFEDDLAEIMKRESA